MISCEVFTNVMYLNTVRYIKMWRILLNITMRLTWWKFCADVENVEEVFEEVIETNLITIRDIC